MKNKFIDSIKIKGKGEIELTLVLLEFEHEGYKVVLSPALDLHAYGKTRKTARKSFDETLTLYLDHVTEERTLFEDLKNLGWTKHHYFKKRFKPPTYVPSEIVSMKGLEEFSTRLLELQL